MAYTVGSNNKRFVRFDRLKRTREGSKSVCSVNRADMNKI